MSDQTVTKKKRGPPATGKGTQIQVRLHDDLLSPLDDFAASQPDDPSRAEAIRRILRDHFMPADDGPGNKLRQANGIGAGVAFAKALIGDMRTFARNNPNASPAECKQFVLDQFPS
jgi:hypothetical protein